MSDITLHYASPGHYRWPQPIDSCHQDVIHALRNHYVDCYEESNFIPNQIIYWDPIHNNLNEDKFVADTQSLFHFNWGIPQEIAFLNNLTKISRNIPMFVWMFEQMDVIMKHLGFVPPFSIVALGNTYSPDPAHSSLLLNATPTTINRRGAREGGMN